jgi:hypothetical protein
MIGDHPVLAYFFRSEMESQRRWHSPHVKAEPETIMPFLGLPCQMPKNTVFNNQERNAFNTGSEVHKETHLV